jgi:hypothetical protein
LRDGILFGLLDQFEAAWQRAKADLDEGDR